VVSAISPLARCALYSSLTRFSSDVSYCTIFSFF
jgi:hypothetical protein